MKFVFNDSLTASIVSDNNSEALVNKFVSSDIILEKRIVTATIRDMNDLFAKLNTLSRNDEISTFLTSTEVEDFLQKGDNRKNFYEKYRNQLASSGGRGSSNTTNTLDTFIRDQIQEGASMTEDPASKFAPFFETKDAILARLDGVMSREDAGEIFYKLEEKVKLSFTETIGIVDYCLNKSRACSAKVSDILNFFIDHYGQKRQYSRTKDIINIACEYQKLNPTIDIFSVLRDSAAGNQPKVNLGYLSKDPQDQLIFNNLIFLSQANAPEQTEEIRRRMQESRDAVDSKTQKINMQRAIFDMMKIEESNKQLEGMINNLGEVFKFLLTQPMYRALRGMYYDLRASKIILNQASSIFAGDTSPEQKRNKPNEDMYFNNTTQFPTIQESRVPFSNSSNKFVKLASPELTRHIYSQTAPNVSQTNKITALNMLKQIYDAIGAKYRGVIEAISGFIDGNPILKKVKDFFLALSNAISTIITAIQSNKISAKVVEEQFKNVEKSLLSDDNLFKTSSSNKFIKVAQLNPQQGPVQIGSGVSGTISKVLGILNGIGGVIIGALAVKMSYDKIKFLELIKGNWLQAVQTILPAILYLKQAVIEALMQFELFGRDAPQSRMFYDNGQLTDRGKQVLVNQQETLIAAGVADQDANALAKFSVQSGYLMSQLVTKEENLKSSEQQIVQLGGGRTDYTVGDLPEDFTKKVREFVDFCTQVEYQYKAALNIFKNAFKSLKPGYLNEVQKTQMTGLLAKFEKDLIEVQKKKSEWSSVKNIASHLNRKAVLLQKIKPLLTQLDTLKKLGIPVSEAIASPNGILAQAGAIRNEIYQALIKVRKEYLEQSQLLKNPDVITPLVKYPNDTGVTKLPESPNQTDSDESPFDAPVGSQFNEAAT